MTQINQIPRLLKIPQLLNKKREAEKERKDDKEEEQPFFSLDENQIQEKPKFSKTKKKKDPQAAKPQSADKSVGNNIDLIA